MLQRMTLTCSNWRTVRRGTLLGFTDVTIVELRLIVRDVAVHQRSATKLMGITARKPSIKNGALARRPGRQPDLHTASLLCQPPGRRCFQ